MTGLAIVDINNILTFSLKYTLELALPNLSVNLYLILLRNLPLQVDHLLQDNCCQLLVPKKISP